MLSGDVPQKWKKNGEFWELIYRLLAGRAASGDGARAELHQALGDLHPERAVLERAARPIRDGLQSRYNIHLRQYLHLYRVALAEGDSDPGIPAAMLGLTLTSRTLGTQALRTLIQTPGADYFFSGPFAGAVVEFVGQNASLPPVYDEPGLAALLAAAARLAAEDAAAMARSSPRFLCCGTRRVPLISEIHRRLDDVLAFWERPELVPLGALVRQRIELAASLYRGDPPPSLPEQVRGLWPALGQCLSAARVERLGALAAGGLREPALGDVFLAPADSPVGPSRPGHWIDPERFTAATGAYREGLEGLAEFDRFARQPDGWRGTIEALRAALAALGQEVDRAWQQVNEVPSEDVSFERPLARELWQLAENGPRQTPQAADLWRKIADDLRSLAEEIEQGRIQKDLDIARRVYSCSVAPLDGLLYDQGGEKGLPREALEDLRGFRLRLLPVVERGGYEELGDEKLCGRRVAELDNRDWIDVTGDEKHPGDCSQWRIVEVRRPGYWLRATNQIIRRALVRFG